MIGYDTGDTGDARAQSAPTHTADLQQEGSSTVQYCPADENHLLPHVHLGRDAVPGTSALTHIRDTESARADRRIFAVLLGCLGFY